MISQNQIEKGLANWLDREFLPKLHIEPWKLFLVATASASMVKRTGMALNSINSDMVKRFGIMDEAGNVDIELLAAQAKANIPPEGLKIPVPMLGDAIIHASDIDVLYQMICES